jgi:hypothetical protein
MTRLVAAWVAPPADQIPTHENPKSLRASQLNQPPISTSMWKKSRVNSQNNPSLLLATTWPWQNYRLKPLQLKQRTNLPKAREIPGLVL